MENKPEKKEEAKTDCNFIYFIDTHEKTKKFKIYLSEDYKEAESLEKIKEDEIKKDLNELAYEVYRFKIIPGSLKENEDKKYHILVFGNEEDGKKHQYSINFMDDTKDFYEYDFKIEEIDNQPLSHEEQFEIYVEILRKTFKKQMNTPENENLILSTSRLIDEEGKKYNFFFYLLIFLECYKTKFVQQHLLKFKPEKIEGLGTFPEKKLNQIKKILNLIGKNPSKSLSLQNTKDETELMELFYSILLYFNINFEKDKAMEMFKDDKILTYLSKKLISFHSLYQGLILEQDIVIKLIEKAKTTDEILGFLPYIGNDIIDFLELIYKEKEHIFKIYEDELDKLKYDNENKKEGKNGKKEIQLIDVEKFIVPKKTDDIAKINVSASKIFVEQSDKRLIIIKFSQNLIAKYIEFYNLKNLDGLQLISNLINLIKKNDKKFEFKYEEKDIDLIIHDTGINLIKIGEMKNNEILDFIKSDLYFNDKSFDKKFYRPLEIFDNINIETLDEKFFNNWCTINFNKMFSFCMNDFYKKLASKIKDMKDFGILLKLFLIDNAKEYKVEALKILKDKYLELFPTLQFEKCQDFVKNTITLISSFDSKKCDRDIKELLGFIQNNLDFEKVNELYLKLTEENKNLTEKTKSYLVQHFTTDKNNLNPTSLVYLIKNCVNLRKEIFSKINKFILTENDFLSVEETENFKLFKGLIDNNIIDKEFQYKGATYVTNVQTIISALENKIDKFDIKYNDISICFQNGRNTINFKKKLLYLYFSDKEKQEKNLARLESKVKEVKSKIEDFELIFGDFRDFFYIKHEKDLKKLTDICFELKNNNLNYFENKLVKEYEAYSKYLEGAQKRNKLKKSVFFREILNHNQKNVFKNNEEKALAETEKSFNQIKVIFKPDGLNKIDENLLDICVKPFIKNADGLITELNILGEIFDVKGDFKDLLEELLLFSKRGFIFEIVNAIHTFFSEINPKKTEFTKIIESISLKMKEKKDIQNIKECNKKLEELKIFDGYEKDNQLINILIKFKEQPESILFLLKTSIQELNNLQEIATFNDNNNNIVNVNDILDMQKCIEFFNDIGSLDKLKSMNDSQIYEMMDKLVKGKKDIYVYFERYVNNYGQIKLLKTSVNTTEFLKYKIQNLFKGCEFLLSNSKEIPNSKELLFKCIYLTEKNEKAFYRRGDIISLRDRALLAKKITTDYKYFIDSISEIINISNILNEIYIRGYPKIINIKIEYKVEVINNQKGDVDIKPDLKFYSEEKVKNNFKEITIELKNILIELKAKQLDGYKTKPLIRYLYGRQFNLLYSISEPNKRNQIEPLLKYITNDCYHKRVDNFKVKNDGDLIHNNIQDWENYLNQILKHNKLTLDIIYKPTLIIQKNLNIKSGVFTYVCEKPEKNLFQIYKFLTGNNPIAQNILLCNKMTSNEEITAFLYRAILCEFNSCFIVAGLELLETEKKTTILDILNNYFQKGKEKINSCLIFLYMTKNSDIYKSLEMKRYRQILEISEKQYDSQKYEQNDIEIIKSDKSGVGKSTQIQLEIERSNKTRLYFPFGGAFSQEEIISRLKNLKIDNKCVLHLDLYDSDQTNLMMEVLFSILITRFYGHNEEIFFLPKNISIKVEIPNTFINFFEKFQILNLFNIKEMKISNLAPLIINDENRTNIEVVANYLKALKENKINDYDLIFPKITPVDFKNRVFRKQMQKKYKKKGTSMEPELIPVADCQKLIFDIIKQKIKEPNYYQIISFINVLAIQLIKLNKSFYLNAFELMDNDKSNITYVRTFIVNSFIKLTSHFTEGAFSDLLQGQIKVSKSQFGIYDEEKDLNNAINNLSKDVKDVISFDKIDPSLIFFHEGKSESFSIITNKPKNDPEYKNMLALKNSQFEYGVKGFSELTNYLKNDQEKFLTELKEILDISTPVKKGEIEGRKSLEEIAGDYVFTADNFVKMVLILIRIRSGIPVIMMGETGCGKTSLIRKLSEMKNNGAKDKMKILNIHAGTNDEDIIKFINEKVIPEANDILVKEEENKINFLKNDMYFEYTKLWVFLDEINTCKSMGLISELMCKHTCQGKKLPENIVFIAACNPYRMREKKAGNQEKVGLNINQAHNQLKQLNQKEIEDIKANKGGDLVYTVNPLPHSLLNFVFYFGKLKKEDEQNYIKCIIKKVIEKIYYPPNTIPKEEEKEDEKIKILKKLACELIETAQEYIREKNDKSAVSLREIRRVNIFYEFFYKYLTLKKSFYKNQEQNELYGEDSEFYKKLDNYSMQVYSLNLSIFVCYYLRITSKEQRKELEQKFNNILAKYEQKTKLKNFLDLPLREEIFIVNNIKLDKGIAKNRALLENIFSLFVAINSKVPIFIVGKPGCSKSLSMQLVSKSMQGTASEKPFFKLFPKNIIHSYQGSLSSTSKGVENVFAKARETLMQLKENKEKEKIISLIYFDEMGLAEHSPNNPLKVIHSELEYDQNENEKQVAFVGISNWNLDAAKMNRGISISIPEPDEEDNKETAFTIGNSYNEAMALRYKTFYENLGKSYYNYKKLLKENYSSNGKEDLHGNRDFYHLVKNSSRNMIEYEAKNSLNDETLLESAIDSIERNFSGIQFDSNKKASLEIYKQIFHEIYPACEVKKEYDVLKRIKENINDANSRYLLVSSESSIGTYLLTSILEGEKNDYSFYIGSPFEQDLNSEEYALKVLNKIQSHMERGNILILKNLETVYPNMYDLFNQNFTVISNKNYSRLAVGSNTNTFAYVDKDFRCIVNVETSKLDQEEAPFLNRFEKHIMSFEYMMDEELIREAEKIKNTIDGFFNCNKAFKAINYDLKKLMINCGKEEIQALVYNANKNGVKKENISDYVLEKISMTLPQDILVNLKISGQKQTKNLKKILDFYYKGEHSNFPRFLEKTKNLKNIVYTFTGYLEDFIEDSDKINNALVGEIKKDNIKIIQLNSIKSEREFEVHIDDYLNEDNLKVCIIKFLPGEGTFMNYIKYFIENKLNEKEKNDKKLFIFMVYMSRISNKEINEIDKKTIKEKEEFNQKILKETLSNLSGFYQIFIDNLNGSPEYKIEKILNMKRKQLFESLLNPDEELSRNIFTSISYMKYNIVAIYKGLNQENYVDKLIEFISNNKRLRDLMNETLFNQSFQEDKDIITTIFKTDNLITGEEIEILSVIKKYLTKIYTNQLSLMYFKAEKDQFFSSLLTNSLEQKIWPRKDDKNKDNNEIEEEINQKKEEIYEDKTIIEKLATAYLKTMVYNDGKTNIVEKIKSNKVDIIFGLKIPGIKPIIEKICISAKDNTLKNYNANENELRNFIEEEELEEKKKTYFDNLVMYDNSLVVLIKKEEKFLNIMNLFKNNEKEEKELYQLITKDYYSLFLNNHFNKPKDKKDNEEDLDNLLLMMDNFDNNIKYLNLMVDLRNSIINQYSKKEIIPNSGLQKLAATINWIECYSEEINSLQQIFLKLNMKIPELFEQIEKIINSEQIKYEISERNPEYFAIINKVFFLSLDSILRILTSKPEVYELPIDDFFDLINTNKEVLQNALQLEAVLQLRSKEAFSLQQILKLINALYLNKLANKENVKQIIKYFNTETTYLQKGENSVKKLCSEFDQFYITLEKMMGHLPPKKDFNFYKLLSVIMLDEFLKIQYSKFRENILNKILKKNELIKFSSEIIKIIIENAGVECNPESMEINLENIRGEDSSMFLTLNKGNNAFLDEVIMNIFERKIIKYFELIPEIKNKENQALFKTYFEQNKNGNNKTGIIFDKSFQIFQETIKILDSISTSNINNKNKENTNLLKLYSIVYVKIYLNYLTTFIVNNFKEMKSIDDIMKSINDIKNKEFSKVIKIYILKLIFNLMNSNYEEFKNFKFDQNGISFYKEFEATKKAGDIMLTYFFLPSELNDYGKYNDILSDYIKDTTFHNNTKEIEAHIDNKGLDLFLIVVLNKIISNLPLGDFENKDVYKNFSIFAKKIFNSNIKPQFSKDLCILLDLFFDSNDYKNKTKKNISKEIGKIDIQVYEALLYGFRFCVNTLYFEKGEKPDIKSLLFPSILTKDCQKSIDSSLIPGNDNKHDLHIATLDSIKFHFDTFDDSCGCYVCNCGFYYNIDPCGFPTTRRTFNCPECNQKCGWGEKVIKDKGASNHGMIIRPGHYRIFKDMAQKKKQMSRWNDPDENIPNRILNDYINEVIEPIRKKSGNGFNVVDRDFFEKQDKKIRKLSNIGYRLLNFISYCHLFYSYCLGNISKEKFNQCLIKNCDILKIIQIDWNLLKESLQQKDIDSIQIFLNSIFTELSKLIKQYKITKNENDREKFENQVEGLIIKCIKNYPEYSKKYSAENQKQSDLDIKSLKTYVTELVHPSSSNYSEKEYPMFKYFNYTKYKSEGDMEKRMNNKERYALIKRFLIGSPEVKNLSYLLPFNEFTNYMVNYYSFKISREKAKEKSLQSEEIVNEKGFNNKLGNFIKAWDHIKKYAKKYKCRPEMEEKKGFSKEDKLINFLNDANELYNGMYLASACQNFIEWQNTFLQPIVDANSTSQGILHNYINNIVKKIPVQDAKHDQIVLIKERFEIYGKYIDFNDVIYNFSERNIFGDNGKINYSDYNTFVYDYDRIEEELGKIILPGVCLFEGEDNLNFVTYWGEGFRGGNSEMISKFYGKYKQKDLNNDEKQIVFEYISNMNKNKSAKANQKRKYDFKEFFGSLQILLFYLTEKGVVNEDEKIVNVIKNAPGYLKLSNDCKSFFYNDGKQFSLNQLMNLFFFFEHLCFEDLAETLQPEYRAVIPDDIKNKIIEKLVKKKDLVISVKDLGAATRRFISRYLAGKLQVTDITEDRDLSFELSREELWEEKIGQLEDLMDIITNMTFEFKLKVGQAYDFYNIIGDEDRNSLNFNNTK